MRAGLVQLTSGDDPGANLPVTLGLVREAAEAGAELILTPEVTNCVSTSRSHQNAVLHHEADDPTLVALREAAQVRGVWLQIGSLALKTGDADGRFANRSFLIAPSGEIAARYDKIHMFDVVLSESEKYQESAGYRPGERAVLAQAGEVQLGMTICYDIRFAALYRALAQAGAEVITVPSAFSPVTGGRTLGGSAAQPRHRNRVLCFGGGTMRATRGGGRETTSDAWAFPCRCTLGRGARRRWGCTWRDAG